MIKNSQTTDFCVDAEDLNPSSVGRVAHNPSIANRQNDLCGGRSAWSVIRENQVFPYNYII